MSVCSSCGNISAWHLASEELGYLLSDERNVEYGISWVYNPAFIEEQYKDYPQRYVADQLLKIAKNVEDFRNKVENKDG